MTAKKQEHKNSAPRGKSQTSATAAAILGRPVSKGGEVSDAKRVKPEWQKYYQHLVELRDQLRRQMDGLAQESAQEMAGYSLHMADSGTDNFDRDFALSLLSSDQDAIYEIEEALKRIEKKTYGVCELTGKSIPKARLEAIPWTRFTVEAQAQLEKDGALKSRRLGQLGTIETAGVGDGDSDEGEEQAEESSNKVKEKE
ncbi:MAG TPA: TraR/DksA C4-type zinc finger protein [Verrucomicrobiae bacterium]|nr:TraR/DksA C4-type zinc finger protein [Verrucomicrobiae bacterium]